MRKLFAIPLLMFFLSCSKDKAVPDDIIPPEKMELVLWDYMRAETFTRDYIKTKKDSTVNDTLENLRLQKRVFDYYKIKKDDFYKSYQYYTDHPDLMNVLLDSMLAKQNRQRGQHRLRKI